MDIRNIRHFLILLVLAFSGCLNSKNNEWNPILINIENSDKLSVDGQVMTDGELVLYLRKETSSLNRISPILIRGASDTSYGIVYRVMTACIESGHEDIVLSDAFDADESLNAEWTACSGGKRPQFLTAEPYEVGGEREENEKSVVISVYVWQKGFYLDEKLLSREDVYSHLNKQAKMKSTKTVRITGTHNAQLKDLVWLLKLCAELNLEVPVLVRGLGSSS